MHTGARLSEITFVVLDLETTGTSPGQDRIIEVAASRFRNGEQLEVFQSLVRPGRDLPAAITDLTGITEDMLAGAPPVEEVLSGFVAWIGDDVLVGHNLGFDTGFLEAALESMAPCTLGPDRLDTLALARRLVDGEVPDMRLGTLAVHFGSPTDPSHRALADAMATAHVLTALLARAAAAGAATLDDLHRLVAHPPLRLRVRRLRRQLGRLVSRRIGHPRLRRGAGPAR